MEKTKRSSFFQRLHKAFGPLAGGILLDLVDFATFGPLGIYIGFIAGFFITWYITSVYRFRTPAKIALSILAGFYCMLPFTELIPAATILSAIARFFEKPSSDKAKNAITEEESRTGVEKEK